MDGSDFLAMLGHELRNPLAGILNGIEVLEQLGLPEGEAAEMCGVIRRQASQMSHIVDDLLEMTRLTRGTIVLKKEQVDLSQLVRDVAEDHRRHTQNQEQVLGLKLPASPVWLNGDRTRLSQILANLLANATRFVDGPGEVTIEVARDDERQFCVLSVRDSGVGMDRPTLETIFQPFMQADSSLDRSRGGLGLGLALVKGLVELHGGRVSAASPGVGQGSQFTVELPTGAAPEPGRAAQSSAQPAVRRRVLLIDDRRDAILPAKRMLELAGHDVFTACDGPSGVALASAIVPDVILCDIGLPGGMTGYDVAAAIRSAPAVKDVYLVAVSGYGQEEDRQRARAAGFDNHLTKPVGKSSLDTMMASLPRFPDSKRPRQ